MFDMPELERRDRYVTGAAFIVPLIAAVLLRDVESIKMLYLIDNLTQYFAGAAFIASAVLIYLVHDLYGGDIGRALEVTAIGLIVASVWGPYATWHILGAATEPAIFGPAWLGIHPTVWGTFFHTLYPAGYAIVAYGFYLFWRTAQE